MLQMNPPKNLSPHVQKVAMWDQRTKGYIPQISLFFNKNIQNEPDKNDVTMKSRVN